MRPAFFIATVMSTSLFDQPSLTLISGTLRDRGQTISVAESVTSGLLQAAFSTAESAMDFYQGGLTAYNIGQKCRYFSIDPIHAMACHCVSETIAQELATGAATLFSSDWGIGITGFATPVPESGHQLFACYAISFKDTILETGTISGHGQPALDTQLYYANSVLKKLAVLCVKKQAG